MSRCARPAADDPRLSAEKVLEEVSTLLMLNCENVVDGLKVLLKQNDFLRDRVSRLEDDKNSLLRKLSASNNDDVMKDCTDSRTIKTNSAYYEDVFEIFGCKTERAPQHNAVNGKNCTTINASGPGKDNNADFYQYDNPPTTVVKTVHFDATAPTSHTATTTALAVAASNAKLPKGFELVDDRWDYSMECDSISDDGSVVGDKSVPTDSTIPMRGSQCSATAHKAVLLSSMDCVSKSSVGCNTAVNDVAKRHNDETQGNSTIGYSDECICSGDECDIYHDCDDSEASSTAQRISVTNNDTSLVFDHTRANEYAIEAVQLSDFRYLQILLYIGADVNTTDSCGNTLLILAAQHNNVSMCKLLRIHGADMNRKNLYGLTALSCSSTEELRVYLKSQVCLRRSLFVFMS